MATTENLTNQAGSLGRPRRMYQRGVLNTRDSRAVRIDRIASGVDTNKDMVRESYGLPLTWPGDPFLPLRTVRVIPYGDGAALRVATYGRRGVRAGTGDPSVLRADVTPLKAKISWWQSAGTSDEPTSFGTPSQTADATHTKYADDLNLEWNDSAKEVRPKQWNRPIEYSHIEIPTVLTSSPLGTVDGMINKVNDANFEIDGITYAKHTLIFLAPEIEHMRSNNGTVEYEVVYHYLARADRHERQVLTSTNDVVHAENRLTHEETNFSIPPYNG